MNKRIYSSYIAFVWALLLCPLNAVALTYAEWIEGFSFPVGMEGPMANPDHDNYPNGLEYVFGTNPLVIDTPAAIGPRMEKTEMGNYFVYRLYEDIDSGVSINLEKSNSLKADDWVDVQRTAIGIRDPQEPTVFNYRQDIDNEDEPVFCRLVFIIPYTPEVTAKIEVGTGVGDNWDGIDPLVNVYVYQKNPPVSDSDDQEENSKYPRVVGANQVSFTENLLSDYEGKSYRPEKRSWMGWFLWGNGTPPPGHFAGYPYKDPNDNSVTPWDFYVWQYTPEQGIDNGSWTPVRMDQQPLYMQPLRLNYNWPAGKFGYETQPMKRFEGEAKYYKEKKIARGVNISPNFPYFCQYGNYVDLGPGSDYPEAWKESWLRIKMRPLETLLLVPSVLPPDQLLTEGNWNNVGSDLEPDYELFPYPVFNSSLKPQQQTPYAILTDKMGDWHADLVWEGTNPTISAYDNYRYRRTAYAQQGQGNYLKMTVAQSSPFIWCEFNASRANVADTSRYMIFYNLIRQNLKGSLDNNTGTDAGTVAGGPWEVPGVEGVSYVLLYGNQNNPNQWFMEVDPEFNYRPDPVNDPDNVLPGGFNPPGSVDNHTYFAVFYRTDTVDAVSSSNSGTDAQGNPYFYLKFKETGKNWFVVGEVPVMRYYHTGVTRDSQAVRDQAARDWADEMGKYAFNFLTDTLITYDVTNMSKVTTHFDSAYQNPYVEIGAPNAAAMSVDPNKSIWALMPHQYQPITLGPDLTKGSREQVVWEPLQTTGIDFPSVNGPPNANKNNVNSSSRWSYWHPRGNLLPVVTGNFTVEYPFQNFLPAMPPPKWEENYQQSGIQQVVLSGNLESYTQITTEVTAQLEDYRADKQGSGAEFKVLLEPYTGRILQVDVISPGSGYPVGNPPPETECKLIIDPPTIGSDQATARIQTDGDGRVLAVFMNNKGSGYRTTISITQTGNPGYDPAIVVPEFGGGDPEQDPPVPNHILPGKAKIITGGSGFIFGDPSKPITATINGVGTGGIATITNPGEIFAIESSTIGGFDNNGGYPLVEDSLTATAANINVEIPPPPGGGTPPTAEVVMQNIGTLAGILIENPGDYSVPPTGAHYFNDNDERIELTLSLVTDGQILKIDLAPEQSSGNVTTRKQIQFDTPGTGTPCVAWAYPLATIQTVNLTGGTSGAAYDNSVELVITGGNVGPGSGEGDFEMPEFNWNVDEDGLLVIDMSNTATSEGGYKKVEGVIKNGRGFWGPVLFQARGGRGHNAAARAVTNESGVVTEVEVLRPGSNYPVGTDTIAALVRAPGGGTNATVSITVNAQGQIDHIDVVNGGSGFAPSGSANVEFTAVGGVSNDANPPRGPYAEIVALPNGDGTLGTPSIRNNPPPEGPTAISQRGYLPSFSGDTNDKSGRLYLKYFDVENRQLLSASSQGAGFLTQSVPVTINVEQTLYDNVIGEYTNGMSDGVRPFGGAFGGKSAPDGYGLGNQLSAATKWVNVLYHLQQEYASEDAPSVDATRWALIQGNTPYVSNGGPNDDQWTYERGLPILRDHNPLFTLGGALESSVEMMQRTLSLLHADPLYHNNPTDPEVWKMDYFSLYDTNAGRILINPSATIPVYGVVSSVYNPPTPDGNAGKTKLNQWKPGKLWSGFGVSDQWNDQHYFYGYYLGVAGWAAIFDRSWEENITSKPTNLWADQNQMGTGLDQWFLSVAYDPDNPELLEDIYTVPQFTYQKLPFFDQWGGHGWATGVSPGPAGLRDPETKWSVAVSSGTGDFAYGDENENSIWEGLQSYSAAILWGAGTDRKSLTDVGIYMLATGMTANDMYFADKNYNMSDNNALNAYSWIPVTSVASSTVPNNGNNDGYPANSSYNDGARDAFYVSEPYFGGESSPGVSLYRKFGPTLNNFFYAFPTGSMFILAYPPTAWTMGIARNSDFVRARYGATIRSEWREARDTALFQPGNWLGMAMTSALAGVPYNPGDQPLTPDGTALSGNLQPYVNRLWAGWASIDGVAGREAPRQPAFSSTGVLHFMHALDAYGTPDWTYMGRATNSGGSNDDDSILFLAAFSKLADDGNSVDTTFIAFNPGWTTRYAAFDRLAADSSVAAANISGTMTVAPKKMVVSTINFPVN